MRILVAGGTGVLGRRIVPQLLAAGHQVTVMARSPRHAAAVLPRPVTVVAADALDPGAVAAAVRGAAPDLVMHQLTDLSGESGAANARLRVDGTRNLVDAALAVGVERLVVQSISWCYEPGGGPAEETVPLDAVSTDPARRATVDAVIGLETEAARVRTGSCCAMDCSMARTPGTPPTAVSGRPPGPGS
jgi:nucleoside-diphosphate-sugar epimerase